MIKNLVVVLPVVALAFTMEVRTQATKPTVKLTSPAPSLVGDPMTVVVDGLPPEREVVLYSELVDRYGRSWTGEATFRSDAKGVVDPAAVAPTRATWKNIDATGSFWALDRKTTSGAHEIPHNGHAERVIVSAIVDGRAVASAGVTRWHRRSTVEETKVDADGLVGRLLVEKGDDKRPAILVLTGSGGGLTGAVHRAEHLASRGYAAFALAYFGTPGRPDELKGIRLEYLDAALDWLTRHPRVNAQRIGVIGSSKGGELALLIASRRKDVRAVVGLVPSSVVWQCIASGWPRASSWSVGGEDLRFVPYGRSRRFRESGRLHYLYEDSLKNEEAVKRAVIPIESSRAAVLLVTGRDDRTWPATKMSDDVVARLKAANYARPVKHLAYENAGHDVFAAPYRPVSWSPRNGGTRQGHALARVDTWSACLDFFAAQLGR